MQQFQGIYSHVLCSKGEAIIFAPSRGETFDEFAKMVTGNMVIVENTRRYDDIVWNLHTKVIIQASEEKF